MAPAQMDQARMSDILEIEQLLDGVTGVQGRDPRCRGWNHAVRGRAWPTRRWADSIRPGGSPGFIRADEGARFMPSGDAGHAALAQHRH